MSSNTSQPSQERGCFKMRVIEYHDYKTLMGPCFVSFSLPLLIPGVVLTVVGSYGNENVFPTFGGWHIAGIVILTFAVLMLVSGIILKCCFKPILSADIEEHLSPSPSMITGNKNLGYEDELLGSNQAKLNSNKVGHHDKPHTLVSTHAKKERGTLETQNQDDLKINNSKNSRLDYSSAASHANSTGSKRSTKEDLSRGPPAQNSSNNSDAKKNRHSSEAVKNGVTRVTNEDTGVKTIVTTSVNATVETKGRIDDNSSDAAEKSSFLSEPKRRKKKRRKKSSKHRVSKSLNTDSEDETSARTSGQLPELRGTQPLMRSADDTLDGGNAHLTPRPVLVHDGEHHHHDLHVHFTASPEPEINQSTCSTPHDTNCDN